ncbi:MAG: FHIPEP family type III secretion protein [Bdellovibrionales bacterium]|nr:FHIPEP family type III secretion protein [Bdellovibrionales bacterium]
MKEIVLPIGLIAIIGCMLLPLPPFAVDCLLVINLIFSVLLIGCSIYLSDPIKLSSLPTILLLATLYRLALNISTTRRILGAGDAGEMIEMFGSLLMQGEMFVGLVVFLVITLVQFIVIAKGSERVAEVSARFTLDALPGKQMSIDADVRAGTIDMETARRKREALQIESRFYGALDGAMKFVKGDAIAGIVITAVNIVGGLAVGVLVHDLGVDAALQKYTLLTLGDGLLSQIPALLNSLAAGLVVTRVAHDNDDSLAKEVLDQLGSIKPALIFAGFVSLLLALVGVATIPFLALSGVLLFFGFLSSKNRETKDDPSLSFEPRLPALISIELPKDSILRKCAASDVQRELSAALRVLFETHGLLFTPPDLALSDSVPGVCRFLFRGIPAISVSEWSEEAQGSPSRALADMCQHFVCFAEGHAVDCIDDVFTRRALDNLEQFAPELVMNTVPSVITVTQLSLLLRELVREKMSIRNLDVVLQAAAEAPSKGSDDRLLLEEVRIALRRNISSRYSKDGVIEGLKLDPVLDMWICECERGQAQLDPRKILLIEQSVQCAAPEIEEDKEVLLLTSRGSRRLLQECLRMRGLKEIVVLAEEELSSEITWVERGYVTISDEIAQEFFERMAA